MGSATTICSVLDEYITEVRHEDAVEMEEIASVRIQAQGISCVTPNAILLTVHWILTPRACENSCFSPLYLINLTRGARTHLARH